MRDALFNQCMNLNLPGLHAVSLHALNAFWKLNVAKRLLWQEIQRV